MTDREATTPDAPTTRAERRRRLPSRTGRVVLVVFLVVLLAIAATVLVSGGFGGRGIPDPRPPSGSIATPPLAPDVLVGAGDIASCSREQDEATAALLDTIGGTVFTLGDTAYENGTRREFAECYDPTWGRHKARTRPAVGNHEYGTRAAAGYFEYFGAAAGDPSKGYYSYDHAGWHVIVLNSNCEHVQGCDAGSPQEEWLRADLAASKATCTLAYMHHPRFTSGEHGNSLSVGPLWQALYEAGADVTLAGHDHDYERFAPQDPSGNADPERGLRQVVGGTGGIHLRSFRDIVPNSEVRDSETHGVLKLTLRPTEYEWEFIPIAGSAFTDSGTGTCH